MCFRLAHLHFYYLHILFVSFAIFVSLFCVWGCVIQKRHIFSNPSVNVMICGDFNAHKTEWHCQFPCHWCCRSVLFNSYLWHTTSPRLQISLLTFLSVMIISHIFLSYYFVLILTFASHPSLGKSDHMVVSVDVKFVVKSTNEHPYHHTVYSYSKADWDELRDRLRDVALAWYL